MWEAIKVLGENKAVLMLIAGIFATIIYCIKKGYFKFRGKGVSIGLSEQHTRDLIQSQFDYANAKCESVEGGIPNRFDKYRIRYVVGKVEDVIQKSIIFNNLTDNETYIIESSGKNTFNSDSKIIDHDVNPIGLNPISIIKNNQFMQGDFEMAIQISDALNLLASDSLSDIENVIKSLLIILNADLTQDEAQKARKNRILQLIGQPGMQPDAKFIYQQLDAMGMQNLREYFEEAYKSIVGIPDRKTRSGGGGDTGDAVKLRDGWADIEIVARIKENYFKIAKKKQLAVAINILKLLNIVSQNFKLEDIDIKLPRNKNDNIQTKAQSYSTLMATNTIAPEDALAMADMTTDITGVINRGKRYQESNKVTNNKNNKDIKELSNNNSSSDGENVDNQ